MIAPENRELFKQLSTMMQGRALRAFLEEKKSEIVDVRNCKTWEETQARAIAVDLIDELFSFLDDKKDPGKSPNQYM